MLPSASSLKASAKLFYPTSFSPTIERYDFKNCIGYDANNVEYEINSWGNIITDEDRDVDVDLALFLEQIFEQDLAEKKQPMVDDAEFAEMDEAFAAVDRDNEDVELAAEMEEAFNASSIVSAQPVCWFFRNGLCHFGENCRKLH